MPKSRGKRQRACLNLCAAIAVFLIGATAAPVTALNGAHAVCVKSQLGKGK